MRRLRVLRGVLQLPVPGRGNQVVRLAGGYRCRSELMSVVGDVVLFVPEPVYSEEVDCVIHTLHDPPVLAPPEEQLRAAKRQRTTPDEKAEDDAKSVEARLRVQIIGVQVTLSRAPEDVQRRAAFFLEHKKRWLGRLSVADADVSYRV